MQELVGYRYLIPMRGVLIADPVEYPGANRSTIRVFIARRSRPERLELESIQLFKPDPAMLMKRDIGFQPTVTMSDVREQNWVLDSTTEPDLLGPTITFVRHDQHPSGRWVDLIAPNAIRPRHAPLIVPAPMPKYGKHTRVLLGEMGYAESDIDNRIRRGVVGESWSSDYLPN